MSIRIITSKKNNRPKSSDGVAARGPVNGRDPPLAVGGIYRTELLRSSYIMGYFCG